MMRKRNRTNRVWIFTGTAALTAMLSMASIVAVKQKAARQEQVQLQEQEQKLAEVQQEQEEVAKEEDEHEDQGSDQNEAVETKEIAKQEETAEDTEEDDTEDEKEDAQSVAAMIEANKQEEQAETAQAEEVENTQAQPAVEHQFSDTAAMQWPVEGSVLMNYSMDATVYFPTLQQYKYNPALIIAGTVNEQVAAAAPGTVKDITNNEETGCTVTMDLGNGYTAIYGQLKELSCSVGDQLETGEILGHVSEPTKYYSAEGCNLFFEVQKDGNPIDPLSFLE